MDAPPSAASRRSIDRVAAVVGAAVFALGIIAIVLSSTAAVTASPIAQTTVVSSPIPGDPVTTTVQTTLPPTRPTLPPRVSQETTVTEGGGAGELVVTTSPTAVAPPFLGSPVANLAFQVILVTLAALLLAAATQRILLGGSASRRAIAADAGVIEEFEASTVKKHLVGATELADLSRPLFDKSSVPDARLRLLEHRITLEQEVRKLAQNNDLPSGLTIPYVLRGLVEKKKMSPKLAAAVTDLTAIGDRISRGAEISLDTTTLLTEAYSQAIAKVGGKQRR